MNEKSTGKSITCTQVSQLTDNYVSQWYRQVSRSHAQRLTAAGQDGRKARSTQIEANESLTVRRDL